MEKGYTIPVFDHGKVIYYNHLGTDADIPSIARVSTGSLNKGDEQDKKLLNYLYRNLHSSPLEFCSITYKLDLPLFVRDQFVRHRTAKCLSGDTLLYFDLPHSNKQGYYRSYKMKLKDFVRKWKNVSKPIKRQVFLLSGGLKNMLLRFYNEETKQIEHCNIIDVIEQGEKELYEIELENDFKIKMTKDHKFLSSEGWDNLDSLCKINETNGYISEIPHKKRIYVNKGLTIKFSKIKSIRKIPNEKVYDIQVNNKFNNFIANGIVVHNCNIHSFRYSQPEEKFYIPEEWRKQDIKNRQGSFVPQEKEDFAHDQFTDMLKSHCSESYRLYKRFLECGIAKEMARIALGTNIYTSMYFQMDLNNLMKFFRLRLHSHAQYEARIYAAAMFEIFEKLFPWCAECYKKYKIEIVENV